MTSMLTMNRDASKLQGPTIQIFGVDGGLGGGLNCLIFPRTRNLFVFIETKNQITVFIFLKIVPNVWLNGGSEYHLLKFCQICPTDYIKQSTEDGHT